MAHLIKTTVSGLNREGRIIQLTELLKSPNSIERRNAARLLQLVYGVDRRPE